MVKHHAGSNPVLSASLAGSNSFSALFLANHNQRSKPSKSKGLRVSSFQLGRPFSSPFFLKFYQNQGKFSLFLRLGRPVLILGHFDKHWLHSFSIELFCLGVRTDF
jgi:hypothetical protein